MIFSQLTASSSMMWAHLLYILFVSYFTITNADEYMKREFSLVKPYFGAGMSLPYWDFTGSTLVTSNYIRLTPDIQSRSGAIWNSVPCMTQNWEININFKVSGKGKELFGDGFAIWYARDRLVTGPVFGSKDNFMGLAIILDTYSNHNGPHNHQHPFISAMINNGTLSYDHDRDGTLTQLAGCEAKFRNVEYDTHISIKYLNEKLTVMTDLENKHEWKLCFESPNVKLPTGYYFGASATTGDLSDNHDIITFKFYELEPIADDVTLEVRKSIIPSAEVFEAPRERKDDVKPGMSNVKIFFLILFGMIAAIALAIFGIMYYQKQKETSRKLW